MADDFQKGRAIQQLDDLERELNTNPGWLVRWASLIKVIKAVLQGRLIQGNNIKLDFLARGIQISALATANPNERPFEMFKEHATQIRVKASILDAVTPAFPSADAAFSPGDFPVCLFTPLTDTGYLYCHIGIYTDGSVITRELGFAGTMPANDATNAYYQIGSWTKAVGVITAVSNDAYGPLAVARCRNFLSYPVTWGVTITGTGG